ncbi:MAG: hypothetical protein QOG80_247 [Pseudonocardiales bacterium]|nr:hypothetical protein [Pseudonocardiales bacterium]
MRDSLFWELVMPDEQLAMQIYLYLTDRGRTGYNVVVWGGESSALKVASGVVDESADFDAFSFEGLTVKQPELRQACEVRYRSDEVNIDFDFEAIHDAFSYRSNPDGLPDWFAQNRLEQSGRVRGFVEIGSRRVDFDRIGHRDHSWGVRDWGVPQHWKWFIAYTPSGRVVNGWIWIAYGEWGFGGYVVKDGVTVPIRTIEHHANYDGDMIQRRLEAELIDISGEITHLTMDSFGAVTLPTHDPMSTVIIEAACVATIDGAAGAGQFETHWQGSYRNHLARRSQ